MLINIVARKELPGDTIYVEYLKSEQPNERPVMFLLPGGPGADHSIYKAQIENLSKWADLVLFDPRGCGKSSISTSDGYAMDVCVDDVEEIRKVLGFNKIIVLGTSYGSMVAQGYAIKYGKDVLQGLILVAGAPSYEFITAAKKKLEIIGSSEQTDAYDRLLSGQITTDDALRDYFKIMAPLYSLKAKMESNFHAAKNDVRYNAKAALAGFGPTGFLRKFDWRPVLSIISCPTLVMVGEYDWINPPNQAAEICSLIINSKLIVINGSGHFIWADKPGIYFNALEEFFRENY